VLSLRAINTHSYSGILSPSGLSPSAARVGHASPNGMPDIAESDAVAPGREAGA
jgi:hypothetical protein